MSSVQLKTYAKINLSLDVTGVREDGYHEVSMVMQAVDLCDELSVTVYPAPSDRVLIQTDNPEVPTDEKNTAYRAAYEMLELYASLKEGSEVGEEALKKNMDKPDAEKGPNLKEQEGAAELMQSSGAQAGYEVCIEIRKNIPVAAGLAGGSSNAAGVILALNKILKMNLNMDRLCAVGRKVGADVPFCIMSAAASQQQLLGVKGGAACVLAEGIGEIMTPLRSVAFWVVLAKPPVSVSTAEVYQALDKITVPKHPETTRLIEGIETGNMQKIKASMGNVLENVTFSMCPMSGQLKERMNGKGSIAAMMSGSGPTVFSLFSGKHRAMAMASSLKDMEEAGCAVFLTKTL